MDKKLLTSKSIRQDIFLKIKSVDTVNHVVEGVFSAEVEDRQGETVVQRGWKLDNYMKNPVVLWAHKHDELPIAKMLEIGVNAGTNQLEGKMQFAVNESDFAEEIYNLVVGGYVSAFSAGFINNKYEIDQENDRVYLVENELLEVSVVPVPANQLALAKSKGIDVTEYETEIKESNEASEKDAVEMLTKSNKETILKAIGTLNDVLKASEEADKPAGEVGQKVEHTAKKAVGQKEISLRVFNKAIRELLKAKKSL